MTRHGAAILIDFLQRHGVRVVAGMPGGANLPIYDALAQSSVRHVLARHEQAAGFIAQGMARVSGRAGVCLATSGPGATNLVTALADARMDSVPLVAITGQVPTALIGTDAFQEVDTLAMVKPVVKHAVQVRAVDRLEVELERAFAIAESGRPGPVLIDLPKDVQLGSAPDGRALQDGRPLPAPSPPISSESLVKVAQRVEAAVRPVLYVGGGVTGAGAHRALSALARKQQIPVAMTLMGLGCFDPDHPLSLGMLGMHAAPFTNLALREADLVLAVGVRFDDRATGKLSEFCPDAEVVHADIDAREIGKLRGVEIGLVCDAREFLERLAARVPERRRPAWAARVAELRAAHPMPSPRAAGAEQATALLGELSDCLPDDAVVTTDVGQHQMWVAQHVRFRRPRRLLTSGGLGAMGFGLPAAIGAALETGGRAVCVSGDGSLLIAVHELATLAELALDVTVLVLDNGHLGLVRQQQSLFYGGREFASRFERATDLETVARGFGVDACTLAEPRSQAPELRELLAMPGPRLIVAKIGASELVLPMVAPGAANHEMVVTKRSF